MSMIKRIALFMMVNLAFVLVISVLLSVFGVGRTVSHGAMNYGSLAAYSFIVGMAGSFLSLLLSKPLAKFSTGAKVISAADGNMENFLVSTAENQARVLGISPPEVAVYESDDINAFATGAFKNSALVALSTGLLQGMSRKEIEAVIGHEMGHVANGDMVSMALVQGVVNTFVIALSKIIAFAVDKAVSGDRDSAGDGFLYYVLSMVLQLVLGFLAFPIVAWFSRVREFRADHEGARLTSPQAMASALLAIERLTAEPTALPAGLRAFGISSSGVSSLFSTHPPIAERVKALTGGV